MDNEKTETILWRSVSKAQQHRLISKFMHLDLNWLDKLDVLEINLFLQWFFAERGRTTRKASIREDHFDLMLTSANTQEFARMYLISPIHAVYRITSELKGTKTHKIYLFCLGKFSSEDKRAQNDYPLFLDVREAGDLIKMLQEFQQEYKERLRTKHDFYVIPEALLGKPKPKPLFSRFWRKNHSLK